MKNDLERIKKGDSVVVTDFAGRKRTASVTSAGPAWITVGRNRYHRHGGRIEDGGSGGIDTVEYDEFKTRVASALRGLELLGIEINRRYVADEQLEALLKAVRSVLEPD